MNEALYNELRTFILEKHESLLTKDPKRGIDIFNLREAREGSERIYIGSFNSENGLWEKVKNDLFGIDLTIHPTGVNLDYIIVPKKHRKKGIAGEMMAILARHIKEANKRTGYSLVITMADVSPGYGRVNRVTSHLVEKNGLTHFDPDIDYSL